MNKASEHLDRALDLLAFGAKRKPKRRLYTTPGTNKVPLKIRLLLREGAQDDAMFFQRENDTLEKLISNHLRHANVYLLQQLSFRSVWERRPKNKPQHTIIEVEITVPSNDPTPETVSDPLLNDLFKKVGIWCERYFPNTSVDFRTSWEMMEWVNNPNRCLNEQKTSIYHT